MLVLSRRRSQAIVIGDDIRVTVLKTQGDTVRLGIEAPPHVSIHRDEVHDRIQAEILAAHVSQDSQQSQQSQDSQLSKDSFPESSLDSSSHQDAA